MLQIDRLTTLNRHPEAVFTEVDGETVFLSLPDGMYYVLDRIGTRIWSLLEVPKRPVDLCDVLVREFDVPPQDCERDLLAFAHALASHGLIAYK